MAYRKGTKMADAVEIYEQVAGNRAAFLKATEEIFSSKSTRATYFNLAFQELQTEQDEVSALIRSIMSKTTVVPVSAVKPKRGTTEAAHVQLFMSIEEADEYNLHHPGFITIPGEQELGKKVGTTVN